MWILDTAYAVTAPNECAPLELDNDIETLAAPGKETGAGCGWGMRDIQFEFDHAADAILAQGRVNKFLTDKFGSEAPDTWYASLSQETLLP